MDQYIASPGLAHRIVELRASALFAFKPDAVDHSAKYTFAIVGTSENIEQEVESPTFIVTLSMNLQTESNYTLPDAAEVAPIPSNPDPIRVSKRSRSKGVGGPLGRYEAHSSEPTREGDR